jgi:hypothetical protein
VIVGVAQVVVNVADIGAARGAFDGTESFEALDLANHPNKDPFQARHRDRLDMVHLSREGSVAVEITRYHGDPPAGRAPYLLKLDPGATPVVTASVSDMPASIDFWRQAMRFQHGATAGEFKVAAMHPSWQLELRLEPRSGHAEPTSVDAHGCVLITVLTTGIERELQRIHDTGLLLRSTPVWTETVADRETQVAFVEGPSGELVELLQAPK